jgi:hypothetical protein
MPIANYQVPGVYVTQSGNALSSVNPTNLNIAIVTDQSVPGTFTDNFIGVVPASGTTISQLTTPLVNTTSTAFYANNAGFSVTWVSGSTTITGLYGRDFTVFTPSGSAFSSLTTSGISVITNLPSGSVTVTYGNYWGAYGNYSSFNQVNNVLGAAVSGNTITSPATLASYLAFQNGASTVSILPVARVSTITGAIAGSGNTYGTAASVSDWTRAFAAISGSYTSNDPTFLMNLVGVDVVVPLYGFTNASGVLPYTGATVASGVASYLTAQSGVGNYQRAFIGVDGTANQVTASGVQALASGFGASAAGTRISLVHPGSLTYNPGLNSNTGLTNVNFNIPGYYLAAAVAGTFVGQTDVMVPVTNKQINGFSSIPNQISLIDAQSNYLPYGILTVRQKRDGNFWILHGLTTNVTSWLTQEISINAVGDRLANNVKKDLDNSYLVGGPLTKNTTAAVIGTVQGTLTNAVSNGLIQSYQNLSLSVNQANPTTVNVTFQYAPTYPINYIQVTLSLNTTTGQVVYGNTQSNFVAY